jgi:ribosome-associated protein
MISLSTNTKCNTVIIMVDDNTIAITEDLQVPLSEIEFRFSPSRGPGGQHANRSHTRVTLLFSVANSPSLDEPVREKLQLALASRLDSQGVLQVTSQDTRSQKQNRELAIARFISLLFDALQEQPERVTAKPTKQMRKRWMEERKKHSQRKEERRRDWSKDT